MNENDSKKYNFNDYLFLHKSTNEEYKDILLGYVHDDNYYNQVFIYVNENGKIPEKFNNLLKLIKPYDIYDIDEEEEIDIIYNLKEEKYIRAYSTFILNTFGLKNYKLYSIFITDKNEDAVLDLVYEFKGKNVKKDQSIQENKDNNYKSTLYIILRNDINRSKMDQICDISELSMLIGSDYAYDILNKDWDGQIVVLQANYQDLFIKNNIEVNHDGLYIQKELIKAETKIGHGNYKLSEAKVVGLAYFGLKYNIPAYVKTLKLWEGK